MTQHATTDSSSSHLHAIVGERPGSTVGRDCGERVVALRIIKLPAAVRTPPSGFVAGERTKALAAMGAEAAVQKFLAQLDEMFGSAEQPQPATAAYVKAHVFDWAQEPYVAGAYSYPSLGAHDGDRDALAAPVAGTVFWAGECRACQDVGGWRGQCAAGGGS